MTRSSQSLGNWLEKRLQQKKLLFVLLDPDRRSIEELLEMAVTAQEQGVDALLVGSSILTDGSVHQVVEALKKKIELPVILFPGDVTQLTPLADAVLFLSLVSGRNPQHLIGEQVKAAPVIYRYGLETIPTGYILVDSGEITSVQFVSGTLPIPANKPDLAGVHALAAQYLGMKLIYLESGSGANRRVPTEMVRRVKALIDRPLMVGGGIDSPEAAGELYAAGADILVVGTAFEGGTTAGRLRKFTKLTEKA